MQCMLLLFINSYHFLTGFYLSDNDEEMPEDPTATANDEQLPDSPVQRPEIGQPSSPVQQPEIRQPSAFDFHGSMRRLGGNPTSMFSVIDQVDDMLPAGPIVVHSERAGGGARLCNILHIIHILHIVHILITCFIQATSYEGKSLKIYSISLRNICLRYF